MVNRVNKTIDLAIEKKISRSIAIKKPIKDLAKHSKYNSSSRSLANFNLAEDNQASVQRDIYNNMFYNYFKVRKSPRKLNLIKMFKPGEILNSVINS